MKRILFCTAIALTLGLSIQPSSGQDTKEQKSGQDEQSDSRQRSDRMNRGGRGGMNPQQMVERMFTNDKNSDGKLTRDEVSGRLVQFFERMDTNQDGVVTREEAMARMSAGRGGQGRSGPGRGGPGRGGQGRGRNESGGLKVGEKAPNFKLKSLDGKTQTELSVIRAKKPVILFFGSYT
ncbi:MAG: hypothetical protein MK108_16500 [Mariniblastus sp.]|nr:hypothetical protein [Mariniblastus sp.]